MEKKQLDLDAPLLSVRRFSTKLHSSDVANKKNYEKSLPHRQQSLPVYKPDWELGEVTKPAAVPFVWEHIPGRPKGGNEAEAQSRVETSNTPRLPPGRPLDVSKQLSDKVCEDQNGFNPLIEASPLNDSANLWERLKKRANAEGDCDSESEDDDYSDAPDTLSQAETVSMSCSVSGLSGYCGSDVNHCGTFSADIQTREFMMKRFLPAAKAMVLDTPQYVPKKQPMTPQQPRTVRKEVSGGRSPLLQQQRSAIVPYCSPSTEDTESEVEDNVHWDVIKKSVKPRGLFSRFCLKNSLCILNPIPGMKASTRVPTSSTKDVSRLARTAYSGPLTQLDDKHSSRGVYERNLDSRAHSQELPKVKSNLPGESKRLFYSGDLRMMRGSSPYRSVSRGGVSPYPNKASPSPFREGRGYLGVAKHKENVKANKAFSNSTKDVLCHQRHKLVCGSIKPAVEKTLYIDSVNKVELPLSGTISSGTERLKDSSGIDFPTYLDSSKKEESATLVSVVQDMRRPDILEGGSTPTAAGSLYSDAPSSARISNVRSQADRMEGLRLYQGRDLQSESSACSNLDNDGNLDSKIEHILKADDQESPNVVSTLSPLPPPLPKSPSESWLWRTLPSISLRHSFSRAGFHPKKQHDNSSNTGTKWETIVKTSNVHHDHVRYSEELVPHVSQHSQT